MKEFEKEIIGLFEEVKRNNEFDFVQTLINYRGLGTHKLMTNLYEWLDAMEYYANLYNKETDTKLKVRIGLLMYSTFQENSDFYNIIGSLCNVKLGLKPSSYLYWKTKKYDRYLGISEKQNFLLEKLHESNLPNTVSFFNENVFTAIRNNFFHSTYSLSETELILHDSEPVIINGKSKSYLNIQDELFPIIENVISFFKTFREQFFYHFDSYKADKNVVGYFPNKCEVTILGNENGLQGFRISKSVQYFGELYDSGIWYNADSDMFEGHNIRFNFATIETIEIREQIGRYETKDDIHQNDSEFLNLVDRVIERDDLDELSRITNLLLKFGDSKFKKMEEEINPFKKKSFSNYTLPFYEKALEIAKGKMDTKKLEDKIDYMKSLK